MTGWIIAGAVLVAVAAYLLLSGFFKTLRTYSGTRLITCPDNLEPAAVNVNALEAAKLAAVGGSTDLHLRTCSRWPEKAGCGQECVSQIEASPENTLVTTIVSHWFDGRQCSYCQEPIERIAWHERPAAVRIDGRLTVEWNELPPQDLPKALAVGEPVCWSCHTKETFRRENPQLVIERPQHGEAAKAKPIPPTTAVY